MGTKVLLEAAEHVYARPHGWHYHLNKECIMLQGGDFERMHYAEIQKTEIGKLKLNPCPACAYEKGRK